MLNDIVIELWHHGGHWSLIRRLADFDPECDYFAINTGCFNRDTIGARKPLILLAVGHIYTGSMVCVAA